MSFLFCEDISRGIGATRRVGENGIVQFGAQLLDGVEDWQQLPWSIVSIKDLGYGTS